MKAVYLVRRHRLAPAHYQGKHRKVPVYAKEYEVVFASDDVEAANYRKVTFEMQTRMAQKPEPFKYSIGRVKL